MSILSDFFEANTTLFSKLKALRFDLHNRRNQLFESIAAITLDDVIGGIRVTFKDDLKEDRFLPFYFDSSISDEEVNWLRAEEYAPKLPELKRWEHNESENLEVEKVKIWFNNFFHRELGLLVLNTDF